ncbi:unnamed protein product [Rotaria magnacalcarata]
MLNGINTQAAEQLFSWLKNYATILSNLGWRRMPIYLLLLFHYKNLERMKIRPTQIFNIVSCIPNTPTISLAHIADVQQVRQYEYIVKKIRFMIMTEPTSLDKSSSQRLLTANINIDNFQSEQILNDRSDLPINDNKISDQEELVIIDEVETEIILDISNENRALISTNMAMDHEGVYLS